MSDYGCCTLSACYWTDGAEGFGSCDDCPFYEKNYFKENKPIEEIDYDALLAIKQPSVNIRINDGSDGSLVNQKQMTLEVGDDKCTLCPFVQPRKLGEKCAVVKELGFCITELTGGWRF